ncbi:hypothetical protein [uncultured Polaribacter sp.]|uniref:hypothetical protein n=1 Tax=uncultured Polaribacter sp. TaxID=174711 RepID=UPI00260D8FCB|nr:hypothetical protein [uncultured Polaribacter sp.]
MINQTFKEGKTLGTVSYITIIGLLYAFFTNRQNNNYFASFHIRQSLGLHILYFANKWIVFAYFGTTAGNIGKIGVLVLFVLGIISAVQEELKLVPLFGEKFQEWFKNI